MRFWTWREKAIAKKNKIEVFAKIRRNRSILLILRALWHVREVESYALSKFQPPTTLGDNQNVEKNDSEKIIRCRILFVYGMRVFVWAPAQCVYMLFSCIVILNGHVER